MAYGGFPLNRWDWNWPGLPGSSPAGRCPMTTAVPSVALATIQPACTSAERLALAGFLAGLTREACALDLRQFTAWGRARAAVTRRLCIIAGFCKYAVEEEFLDHSPAAHVRRPRVDYESHAVALDRNEPGTLQLPSAAHRLAAPPGGHGG